MAVSRVSPKIGKVIDIPDVAPTIGTATAGDSSVSVAFTPASPVTGGPIFSYKAVSNPGSISGTGTSSPITVSGLTNNTAYTFTVAGVNPTGDGPYSAASNSATPILIGSYESIATTTVGAGSASYVDFTSIPSTYEHLQIRGISCGDRANYRIGELTIQFNSDTGTNYAYHDFYGDGASMLLSNSISKNWIRIAPGTLGGNAGGAAFFGSFICDILDYANTNKAKVTRALSGVDLNGTYNGVGGRVGFTSGLWSNTNAISSIRLTASAATPFVQYTTFALYGIKGA